MTTHRSKSDDSYEEGSFQASKTMTVTRMATPRGPIPVTVDTLEASGGDTLGAGVGTRSADAYKPSQSQILFDFSRASPLDFP